MNKILDYMILNNIIVSEDKELYAYGMKQGFIMILNLLTTIIIGLLFHMIWQALVFTAAYIPLRSYAGGYHARTQIRCYFFSIVLITMSLKFINYLLPFNYMIPILACISSLIIIRLAPSPDENKPLSPSEQSVYKRKTFYILFIELFVTGLFFILSNKEISLCITMSLTIQAFMLILYRVLRSLSTFLTKIF